MCAEEGEGAMCGAAAPSSRGQAASLAGMRACIASPAAPSFFAGHSSKGAPSRLRTLLRGLPYLPRPSRRTMPTVKDEVRKTPSTPWRTQPDIYRERHRKRSRRQQQQGQQEQGGRRRGQAAEEDEQEEEMKVDA